MLERKLRVLCPGISALENSVKTLVIKLKKITYNEYSNCFRGHGMGVEDNIPLCFNIHGRDTAWLLGCLSTSVAVEPGRLPKKGKAARTFSYL